jgi:hypothetical protein
LPCNRRRAHLDLECQHARRWSVFSGDAGWAYAVGVTTVTVTGIAVVFFLFLAKTTSGDCHKAIPGRSRHAPAAAAPAG